VKRSMYLATLAAIGLTAATLAPTSATARQQVAATGGLTSTIEVVASGLNAPRGLVYDRYRQRVLIAEAGIGAQNLAAGNPCGFAERGLPFCLGQSGSIYQHNESGTPGSRIVTGLPSTTLTLDGSTTIGIHDIDLRGDVMTVSFGTLGNKQYRESLGPGAALLGHTANVTPTGQVQPYGDILTFEDNLHAPLHIEANPYGVLGFSWGAIQVNAGGPNTNKGNDLLLVLKNGQIFQLAQFPERPSLTDPTRNIRAVPTSVAIGPDGALYVGELSGAPFFPGEARVWRVVPGHAPTVYQQGFSTIVDIRFDSRGRLIVLQTSNDPFDVDGQGALIRVEKDGSRTTLASTGLTNPGGVALVNDRTFYVTTRLASADGSGSLVKVRVSE
jgi:hypothetical protein